MLCISLKQFRDFWILRFKRFNGMWGFRDFRYSLLIMMLHIMQSQNPEISKSKILA